MKQGTWIVALLGVLSVGCMHPGTLTAGSALLHQEFPYAVTYDDQQQKSVMGEDWTLENYRHADPASDGSAAPSSDVTLERKEGYSAEYEFDFNDDDAGEATASLPSPDLLLVSKKTNARIEVTTLLLDKRLAAKELRVLLSNIVESDAGTRALFVGFGRTAKATEVTKRFASRLLDSGPATLDGKTGLVATVERADLDQLELSPSARWGRSRVLLLHAPFDYYATEPGNPGKAETKYHKYRVLLLVEYTNNPADFEAQYPDLLRLLNKIHFLTDEMLLTYIAEPLSKCKKAESGIVSVTVSEVGHPSLKASDGLEAACASSVVRSYRFAATGETRTLEHTYDFSKPLKPKWLTQASYVEERAPAAESPAATPAAAPADAAPTAPVAPAPEPASSGEHPAPEPPSPTAPQQAP